MAFGALASSNARTFSMVARDVCTPLGFCGEARLTSLVFVDRLAESASRSKR
jgi:hypothetical protein